MALGNESRFARHAERCHWDALLQCLDEIVADSFDPYLREPRPLPLDDEVAPDSDHDDDDDDDKEDEVGEEEDDEEKALQKRLRAFPHERASLTRRWYAELNGLVFDGRLPVELEIVWKGNLTATAGVTRCRTRAEHRSAVIELSTKVIDREERLQRTLAHEMCHAAAWLLDGSCNPPHGPVFWKWAEAVMKRYPGLDVSRCHSYEINYKHRWECEGCQTIVGRHSKSLKTDTVRCAECQGRFVYLGSFGIDNTPRASRALNRYNVFVKENMPRVQQENPTATKQECMKIIGVMWRNRPLTAGDDSSPSSAAAPLALTFSSSP